MELEGEEVYEIPNQGEINYYEEYRNEILEETESPISYDEDEENYY